MPNFFVRWMRTEVKRCLLCERDVRGNCMAGSPPLAHREPRLLLGRICDSCSRGIPWIRWPACRICGRAEACSDCSRRVGRQVAFSRCAVRYDRRMKDLLALYKYRGSQSLEPLMAAMLAFAYERIRGELPGRAPGLPAFDAVTAVPLASERLEDRGFNQAESMARTLAEWYGIPYVSLLRRVRNTEKQSLKSRRGRLADMKGSFALCGEAARLTPLTRILLVDDIYTTGSTVNECARTIREGLASPAARESGGPAVYAALWARS